MIGRHNVVRVAAPDDESCASSARALQTRIDSALAKGDTTFADSLKLLLPPDSLLKLQAPAPKKTTPPGKK